MGRAEKYQHFTADDWKKVIFTDENFEIYGSKRSVCEDTDRRENIPQGIKPTVKRGGGDILN